MTLKLSQTTRDSLVRIAGWLAISESLMSGIENASVHSQLDLDQVGTEWTGTMSRLR